MNKVLDETLAAMMLLSAVPGLDDGDARAVSDALGGTEKSAGADCQIASARVS